MKIAIIGGGISGLSTAYYLKKFAIPASEIVLFESSNRFGGWIDSSKIELNNDKFYFEKGPRTLRLSTGELKEINSIQLANELNLGQNLDLISKSHPAATNRYIYYNKKINPIKPKLFGKSELLPKGLFRYFLKEYTAPSRDKSIEDESIWSFISRRTDSHVADILIDPVFKGITGGDIKYLSSATLLKLFYDYEKNFGSISKGAFNKAKTICKDPTLAFDENYKDLYKIRKDYQNESVWRLNNGMQTLPNRLVEVLSKEDNIKLLLNEPVLSINFDNQKDQKSINLKSKTIETDFDIVISSVYSKLNCQFLPEKYQSLKNELNKIEAVNMCVVNFYFKKDILPFKGFGYLVPSNQKSSILGCIFDSVFNTPNQKNTVLTVMMGGAWYDEYIGNKDSNQVLNLALSEIKKHLKLNVDPDYSQVSFLKNAIPQYKVGHLKLLEQIKNILKEENLSEKFYLTGFSYNGIGLNDCIFNSRKLVQNEIKNSKMVKMFSN